MKNKKAKFLNILYYIILGVLILTFLTTLITRLNSKDGKQPNLFGYTPTIIMSKSMLPTLKVYSLGVIKACSIDDVAVGDIIVYKNYDNNKNIIHRVTSIDIIKNEKVITTQGDNNPREDDYKTTSSNLIGKLVLKANWMASIIKYAINPDGTGFSVVNLAVLSTAIIMFLWLVGIIIRIIADQLKSKLHRNKVNKEDNQNGLQGGE